MRSVLATLGTYPTPKRFEPEPSTVSFLQKHGHASGVYVQRPHKDYKMVTQDVFKIGRSGDFDRRHHDYKGAMTVVAFVPTPFPRVVEKIALHAVQRFVIHGNETVQLPLEVVLEVVRAAVVRVKATYACPLLGDDPPFNKVMDRAFLKHWTRLLAVSEELLKPACWQDPSFKRAGSEKARHQAKRHRYAVANHGNAGLLRHAARTLYKQSHAKHAVSAEWRLRHPQLSRAADARVFDVARSLAAILCVETICDAGPVSIEVYNRLAALEADAGTSADGAYKLQERRNHFTNLGVKLGKDTLPKKGLFKMLQKLVAEFGMALRAKTIRPAKRKRASSRPPRRVGSIELAHDVHEHLVRDRSPTPHSESSTAASTTRVDGNVDVVDTSTTASTCRRRRRRVSEELLKPACWQDPSFKRAGSEKARHQAKRHRYAVANHGNAGLLRHAARTLYKQSHAKHAVSAEWRLRHPQLSRAADARVFDVARSLAAILCVETICDAGPVSIEVYNRLAALEADAGTSADGAYKLQERRNHFTNLGVKLGKDTLPKKGLFKMLQKLVAEFGMALRAKTIRPAKRKRDKAHPPRRVVSIELAHDIHERP